MEVHEVKEFEQYPVRYIDFRIKLPKKKHRSEFLNDFWWYPRDDWEKILKPEFIERHKAWWAVVEPHIKKIFLGGTPEIPLMYARIQVYMLKDRYGYADKNGTPRLSDIYLPVPPYAKGFMKL